MGNPFLIFPEALPPYIFTLEISTSPFTMA